MTEKIYSLTPEQEQKFEEYMDRWIKIGLSTDPITPERFEKAKESAKLAYELSGLTPPEKFYLADSPIAAVKLAKELGAEENEITIFNKVFYGNHDASWLCFYEFARDELGMSELNELNGIIELAKNSGWVNFFDEAVIIQHPPEVLKLDDQKRLHCEDGPAVRYRDGTEIYVWHGVTIPDEWIRDPGHLTAKIALNWENIEERRCACEILGWARILSDLDAVTIDADDDPEIGVLVEVDLPDSGKERFLRVLCGTRREFALPVPLEMKTAWEANAWTYGFSSTDFVKPEVRT